MLDGVRVISPARTWLDLASVLGLEDLLAAGDYFICSQTRSFGPRREAFCSLDDLQEQVQSTPGVRGSRKARQALELCRVGADSAPESRLRLEARQRESDIRRDESIAAVGWQSVTVTAGHVRTWGFDGCAHRVLDAVVRAGWRIERGDLGAKRRS